MLFLPIIDSPDALAALFSAISEQKWLSSRGCSFSMFKREPKKKRKQCTTGKEGTHSETAVSMCSAILGHFGDTA